MASINQRRLAVIQRVSQEWEARHVASVKPDPKYATDADSQYPEGIVFLSAKADAQTELNRLIDDALIAEGLPTTV